MKENNQDVLENVHWTQNHEENVKQLYDFVNINFLFHKQFQHQECKGWLNKHVLKLEKALDRGIESFSEFMKTELSEEMTIHDSLVLAIACIAWDGNKFASYQSFLIKEYYFITHEGPNKKEWWDVNSSKV